MLLELENVRFYYGGAEILRGISIILREKDMICLIGANGAGKTTTLRIISGLAKPTSGEIRYNGKNINGNPPQSILAKGIAQVLQEGGVFRDMTVYENLIMGAYLRKDRKTVNRDLEAVYEYFPVFKERSKQKGGKLSGGERQMLAIGRALMSRPILLLMDEPTSGLAPIVVTMVGEIILRINKDGISIILVEQNADLALNIARYGYVMERGNIALEGNTIDLLTNDMVKKAYLGL